MTINIGSTLIIRSKFSARGFFKDVHDYNATVTQYIGELCRYLVHSPESKYDRGTSQCPACSTRRLKRPARFHTCASLLVFIDRPQPPPGVRQRPAQGRLDGGSSS